MTGKIKQMRNRHLGNGKRRAWTMFTALIVTCAVLLAGMLTPPPDRQCSPFRRG